MVLSPSDSNNNKDKDNREGEILEPDKFFGEQLTFNHQQLVMSSINKCLELGSKELREGWWEEKIDKMGNVLKSYHEDTRKAFIEAVKSLLMITTCDFDKVAELNIKSLKKEIEKSKRFWLEQEWNWWQSLSKQEQDQMTKQGKYVVKGFFNARLDFDNHFFQKEAEIYRDICTEINNLTSRLHFYEQGIGVG